MMNQTKKHTTSKKLLALLLALIMTVSLLPMSVFAAGLGTEPAQEEEAVIDVPATGENGEDAEPVDEDAAAADTYAATDEIAVQEATDTSIQYVTKKQSVPLKGNTFYRIVHIDCGRKYFSFDELKKIIDYAAASNYTHVELAFGNDGLRFLLDDMEVTASGVTYASENVKSAIQAGNKAFYDAGTNELTESEMNTLISYAKSKGIGIIPMFDAPGHLQTVVRAMATLGVATNKYTTPTTSGTSVNYAIDFTDAASVNFVQALMQKYITYFKGQGCTMFNIAADECGFSSMDTVKYTAYAKMVNSMAAMVQNTGMTALAFNDGFYHKNLSTTVDFDTNIAICYWDATTSKYAPAATLAGNGFKIINTHNKWYYVIGASDTGWYGATWSKNNMKGTGASDCIANKCDVTDGGYQTKTGCMNAIWCDTPSKEADMATIEDHIKTLANVEYNTAYFTEVKAPEEVDLPAVNDPETDVGVVVKGQKDQTAAVKVEAKAARTEDLPASAEAAVSYEITPSVDDTAYTGEGTVTLPVPEEWKESIDRVCGYIVTAGKVETIEGGTYDETTGKYTFPVPHFSEMGLLLLAETSAEITEKTITVTVGGTSEPEFIEGIKYETGMSYPTDDPSIATVAVSDGSQAGGSTFAAASPITNNGKYYIQNSSGQYLKLSGSNISWVKSIDDATEWTATSNNGYKLSNGSRYLRYSNNNWTTTTYNSYATTLTFSNGSFTYTYRSGNGWGSTTTVTLGTPGTKTTGTSREGINVTFTGVKAGETTVTIGNVKYTINVIAENLTGVSPLPIQLWITNIPIQVDTSAYRGGSTSGSYRSNNEWSEQKAWYVDVSASAAYGEKGVELSKVLPASMTRYENNITYWIAEKSGKAPMDLVLWSGRIHNKADSNIQKIWDVDYSNSGDEFTYVRYYGGEWAVSSDQSNWIVVTGANSTISDSSCTQQLAAYYMIRTEITSEVSTDVADWGYISSDEDYSGQISKGYYVMLDFAVKYEGGTRNPNTFPQAKKTFVFHCNTGDNSGAVKQDSSGNYYRQLNNFRGMNTGDYEIYMVTVTMTKDAASDTLSSTTSYTYDGEEQIVWAIDEATRDNSNLNEYQAITSGDTTYSGCDIGGDPYVRGVEVYNQHGALITYYIRTRAVEGKLTVHYIDKATGNQFHSYNIIVKDINDPTQRFKETIALNQPNWKGNLIDGDVVNNRDVTQIVSSDLSTMPSVPPAYRYAIDYKCVEVTRNEERTDVYLYYEFVGSKTFVVDFGLPLKITPADFSGELKNATLSKVSVTDSGYATITTDTEKNVIYTLNKTIDGEDTINVAYDGNITVNGKKQFGFVSYTVKVIPASTVYYEDSIASFYDAGSSKAKTAFDASTDADKMGQWYVEGTEQTAEQALEVLGEKKNVYGYDSAYDNNNSTTFSMGSAKKVTVNAKTYKDNNNSWPTATFTFKGTGFDVISLTSNTSGTFFVTVTNKSTGEVVRQNTIDTYYGYHQKDGNWVAEANDPNALYQIPVMKIKGLDYAEYNVEIKVAYASFLDHTTNSSYSFWLDAIRVYDPMGKDKDYGTDYETSPDYVELRQVLVDASDLGKNGAVFIDGKEKETDVTNYANYGPNHEVYLAGSQAIAFKLIANKQPTGVQLAAKQLTGTQATLTVTGAEIGKHGNNGNTAGETLTLTSGTDMYYELTDIKWTLNEDELYETGSITLTNSGTSGIVALTNLKFIGAKYTLSKDEVTNAASGEVLVTMMMDAATAEEAVAAVDSVLHPQEEIKTFTPERFETSWNRSTVKVGQNATLTVKTSEDVEAITVDGVTIDTYRTRTQRTGWGWNAKKVTYREFTYTITASEAGTLNCSVAAINAEGTASEAITATLTVQAAAQRPGWGGWFGNLFSRWF